ncbi:MAG: COX15/CtaA family protein [Pyrinomonadaceae bacterium]|nr:COX15/CtaA family protein [Pyrinomonadaceae bacterium]
MSAELKLSKFAKYAWFVLAYNVVVILWGVFLRASKSGDGCGQHWLTCHGEIIPSAPEMKTVIEFSHRMTSSLAGIFVVILLVWAFVTWYSRKSERKSYLLKAAIGSFVFIVIEGLLGAGLVLTGNTAENLTSERPFWMAAHLINTLILLAFLTLTAWFASGGKHLNFKAQPKVLLLLGLGVFGIFLIGMSGSVAALSSMLFPSVTLSEGIAKDFSETSHILLRLRVSHPILSITVGVFLIFLAGLVKSKARENTPVKRWANVLTILILIQFASGAITLLTLAPIVMQLVHLLLADAVWIAFVLMSAAILAEQNEVENISLTVQEQENLL